MQQFFSATGGTKSTVGSRTYHVFNAPNYDPAPSTFVVNSGSKSVSYLVVGGGGGGGGPYGGGGGGGAVKTGTATLDPGSYAVLAGGGGGESSNENRGGNGSNSTFADPKLEL